MNRERSREKDTDVAYILCIMTANMTKKEIVSERQEIEFVEKEMEIYKCLIQKKKKDI